MAKEKLNVYQRLLNAREIISQTPIKKEGKNKFSNYDYFTPSQIIQLVSAACVDVGLLTVYKLTPSDGDSYSGCLSIYNIDEPKEVIEFFQPTISPEIKATNAAQKIGGMVTYNERYLKMSAFDIADNNLDFDTDTQEDNKKKRRTPPPRKKPVQKKKDETPPNPKESTKAMERETGKLPELTKEIYDQMLPYVQNGKHLAVKGKLKDYAPTRHMDALVILIGKAEVEAKKAEDEQATE